MEVTVEFKCPGCGLLTPTRATLPDTYPGYQDIRFIHACFHCGKRVTKTMTAGEARLSTQCESEKNLPGNGASEG